MYTESLTPQQSPRAYSHEFPPMPFRPLDQASWSSHSLPLRNRGYSSAASNAGSIDANDRLDIDLVLNPILDTSANPQQHITLPSIRTLDALRYAGTDLPPCDSLFQGYQSSHSPRERHPLKRVKARRGSHSSSASYSASPPSSPGSTYGQYTPTDANITSCPMDQQRQPRHTAAYQQSQQIRQQYLAEKQHKSPRLLQLSQGRQSQHAHSNRKYTMEEMHFIQYLREDKRMQWADIVGPFNAQFPNHKRERGALECRYYRFQMYPKVNDDGTFQYDDKGELVMVNTKVRDRRDTERSGGKKWSVLTEYFKLVSRCPEEVLKYAWTDEDDKKRARSLIQERQKAGLTHLPGALLRSRSSV